MWNSRAFITITTLLLICEAKYHAITTLDTSTFIYDTAKINYGNGSKSGEYSMEKSLTQRMPGYDEITGKGNNRSSSQTFSSSVTEALPIGTRAQKFLLFKIGQIFNKYWSPVIIIIGLPGNFLAFLVMLKKDNRRISTCVYMSALCISDSSLLFIHAYAFGVYVWPGWPIYQVVCKLLTFMARALLQFGSYIILFMSIDRFLVVHFPLKSKFISTPRRSMLVIAALFFFAFGYNIHNYFWTKAFAHGICVAYYGSGLEIKIFSWLSFVLNCTIPFSLLITLNGSLIFTIRKRHQEFSETTKAAKKSMKAVERQLSVMSVIVCLFFLICFTPAYIRYIYTSFVDTSKDPKLYAAFSFFYHFSHKLFYTNSAINFYIYFISGQKFRQDLKNILLCRFNMGGNDSIGHSNSSRHDRASHSNSSDVSRVSPGPKRVASISDRI